MCAIGKRKFCLVMALLFALMVLCPLAAFAADFGSIQSLDAPTVKAGQPAQLGAVFMAFPAGQLKSGDSCTMSLPQGFQFLAPNGAKNQLMNVNSPAWQQAKNLYDDGANKPPTGRTIGDANGGNYFSIPSYYSSDYQSRDDLNGLRSAGLIVTRISENQIQIAISGTVDSSCDSYLYLYLDNIYVAGIDEDEGGDINLSFSAPSDSGFSNGQVVVATMFYYGSVMVECTNAPAFTDQGTVTLRLEETMAGSLRDGESLKFTLPDGFSWGASPALPAGAVNLLWGTAADPEQKLDLTNPANLAAYLGSHFTVSGPKYNQLTLNLPDGFASISALAFEVKAPIKVYDKAVAMAGDINVAITGKSDYITDTLFGGQYDLPVLQPSNSVRGIGSASGTGSNSFSNPFSDVKPTDWFYDDVAFVFSSGFLNGTGATTFSPNDPMTRAMFVTALWRLAGSPMTSSGSPATGGNSPAASDDNSTASNSQFTDVWPDTYYTEAVRWAAANGIVNGVSDNLFAPDRLLTRSEIMAFLYRYEQFSGRIPPEIIENTQFSDWGEVRENAIIRQGILSGKSNNLFEPQGMVTRAEAAAALHRFAAAVAAVGLP